MKLINEKKFLEDLLGEGLNFDRGSHADAAAEYFKRLQEHGNAEVSSQIETAKLARQLGELPIVREVTRLRRDFEDAAARGDTERAHQLAFIVNAASKELLSLQADVDDVDLDTKPPKPKQP